MLEQVAKAYSEEYAKFVRLETFLGWICILLKTLNFSRCIKDTTNLAVFYVGRKIAMKRFNGDIF